MTGRPLFSFLLATACLLTGAPALHGQARPTASRAADVQIGVGYTLARPDYPPTTFQGFAAYADVDLRPHLGIEAEFHQVGHPSGYPSFQRTYEVGGRYLLTFGPLVPYAKLMVGRAQFEYPYATAILPYNMFAAGVGADYKLGPYLRIRGEYEFQRWSSFPDGGLTPQLVTVGIAYHFASGMRGR